MSNPRPDPPRLAEILSRWRDIDAAAIAFNFHAPRLGALWYRADVGALLTDRDALLADLRTLEAQWRERAARIEAELGIPDSCSFTLEGVADDLAALLARLEGT